MKRIAIVTGASSGLGKRFAARIGAYKELDEVWLVARREDRLREVAREVPIATQVVAMDVTSQRDLDELAIKLVREDVRVECLVNSAGMGVVGAVRDTSERDTTTMIDLNCRALAQMTLLAIPFMRQGAWIVQIASIAGLQPLPGFSIYAASKAFVQSYSKALHQELRRDGIHVTCVNPYWVKDTEFIGISQRGGGDYGFKPFASVAENIVERALQDARRNKMMSTPSLVTKIDRVLTRLLPDVAIVRAADLVRRL